VFFVEILQVTVELPYVFLQSLIFGTLVYSMVQFEWTPAKFFLFLFFLYFTLLVFTYWGMLTVALTPNAQVAAIISSAAFGIWNLFAGFLVPRPVSFCFFFFLGLPDHFKKLVLELFDA
jgi:ABC-type multidrug transport system permease subunit